MVVNDSHKQAAKAAIARLAIGANHPDLVGLGVSEAAYALGLQLGDFGSQAAMAGYAQGVQANSEKFCNRRWSVYPSEVARLSQVLAKRAVQEVNDILGAEEV